MAKPTRKRRPRLTRERILRAAIRLADDGGIEALSMRRLGRELGVEAMSLYNHVASKDDLLDGITDVVVQEIEMPGDAEWKDALRRHAVSAHEAFRRHPWACNLVLSPARTVPASVRRTEWMLRRLREAGLSAEVTYHAYHALDSHILGFTLWQVGHGVVDENLDELVATFFEEFPPAEYPFLYEHAQQHLTGFGRSGKGAFELVLDLILDGLDELRAG
jgi:AcrR family transcriptional regulator